MEGMEGGGFALACACSRLAQLGEASLLKLVISSCAFYPGYHAGPHDNLKILQGPLSKDNVQEISTYVLKSLSPSLPPNSPALFPLAPSAQEMLSMWPPTIIITSDTDSNISSNRQLSATLKAQGRLLEFLKYSGTSESGKLFPIDLRETSQYWKDVRLIIESYVGQTDGCGPVVLPNGVAEPKKSTKKM